MGAGCGPVDMGGSYREHVRTNRRASEIVRGQDMRRALGLAPLVSVGGKGSITWRGCGAAPQQPPRGQGAISWQAQMVRDMCW